MNKKELLEKVRELGYCVKTNDDSLIEICTSFDRTATIVKLHPKATNLVITVMGNAQAHNALELFDICTEYARSSREDRMSYGEDKLYYVYYKTPEGQKAFIRMDDSSYTNFSSAIFDSPAALETRYRGSGLTSAFQLRKCDIDSLPYPYCNGASGVTFKKSIN